MGQINVLCIFEIGVIDAPKALQDEFAPRQRDIVAQTNDLRGKEEKLQRDRDVMGEAELRSSERELRDIQRELARRQNEYLEDLNLRRNEELGRLQRSLMVEVQNFARNNNYDVILGDGVLFASGAVDITAAVLAGLEQAHNASE
ncbi:MAG: OmpH family outer membrane protein [Pseudomonadota bacterium]